MTAPPTADLTGRVALVTGAARRTGRGLALALARAGADVVVHYGQSRQEAESAVAEIAALGRRGYAIQADLGRPGEAERSLQITRTGGQLFLSGEDRSLKQLVFSDD